MDVQKRREGTVPYSKVTEYDAMCGIFAYNKLSLLLHKLRG